MRPHQTPRAPRCLRDVSREAKPEHHIRQAAESCLVYLSVLARKCSGGPLAAFSGKMRLVPTPPTWLGISRPADGRNVRAVVTVTRRCRADRGPSTFAVRATTTARPDPAPDARSPHPYRPPPQGGPGSSMT